MNFDIINLVIPKTKTLGFKVSGDRDNYLRVSEVKPMSVASDAGLKEKDIILKIGNKEIKNREDIIKSVQISTAKINVQIIRNKETCFTRRASTLTTKLMRQTSFTDPRLLQEDLLTRSGCKIGMKISRSPSSLTKGVKFFEKKLESKPSSLERKISGSIDQFKSKDTKFHESITTKSITGCIMDTSGSNENNTTPHVPRLRRTSQGMHSASIKRLAESIAISNYGANSRHKQSLTLRSMKLKGSGRPNGSLPLNTMLSKSVQSLNQFEDAQDKSFVNSLQRQPLQHKLSSEGGVNLQYSSTHQLYNSQSTVSLFDSNISDHSEKTTRVSSIDHSNVEVFTPQQIIYSPILEYKFQWQDIYQQLHALTSTDFELELTRYFKNMDVDLSPYPINCLYRFITYDDSMRLLFTVLLVDQANTDIDALINDFWIPNEDPIMLHFQDLETLIKMNIRTMNERVTEFQVRKTQLKRSRDKLKADLLPYLLAERDQSRMYEHVDRLFTIFDNLASLSTSIISSIALWKFRDQYESLYDSNNIELDNEKNSNNYFHIVTQSRFDWSYNLNRFKDSQKNLERSILQFFNRFSLTDNSSVVHLFDTVYSEVLNVEICLPIFNEKLKRDHEMIRFFEGEASRKVRNSVIFT